MELPASVSAAEGEEDRRKYEAGPLTADDFRGQPPARAEMLANTATELRYEYRCRFEPAGQGTRAVLTAVEVYAYVRRDLSWNRQPQNQALMDHEQGHADICQVQCLLARLAFRELQRTTGVQASGGSQSDAQAALGRKVAALIEEFRAARRHDDADYDRQTKHGSGSRQSEWRRVQQETLRQLAERWEQSPDMGGEDRPTTTKRRVRTEGTAPPER